MKVKKINQFDNTIDIVLKETLKGNEKSGFLQDKSAFEYYQKIVLSSLDILNLKQIFLNEYIPKAKQASFKAQSDWRNSKYKGKIQMDKIMLSETLNETIRLGYIGMFHKYESFYHTVLKGAEDFISAQMPEEEKLFEFSKREFGFDYDKRGDWKISKTIERINWISNSCKHYNGFPKIPIHNDFNDYSVDKKLIITEGTFKNDIEKLESHCQNLLTIINEFVGLMTSYQSISENQVYLEKERIYNLIENLKNE